MNENRLKDGNIVHNLTVSELVKDLTEIRVAKENALIRGEF